MCKKFNLDEVIKDSVMINIGDACPFCKGKDKFINDEEHDIVRHIVDVHKPEFSQIVGKLENE